jgi:AraC-like DNA-binding protein
MHPALEIRTYQRESPHHHHAFAQLVMPVGGRMEIEVEGRGACLDLSLAAWVAPNATHAQVAEDASRFLVLDCPSHWLGEAALASLAQQTYVPINPTARRLIEFADLAGQHALAAHSTHLIPLLLSTLSTNALQPAGGMDVLLARLEADPGAAWSNEAMARVAIMSEGQLNRRFLERFEQTPQAWLANLRMRHARRWLADSNLPVVDIALRLGFSDQAALTRAMRRLCDTTPAAWRRNARRSG